MEQNGVVECDNHTLVEMTKNMLSTRDMHMKICVEAMTIIIHLFNHVVSCVINHKTLIELWNFIMDRFLI